MAYPTYILCTLTEINGNTCQSPAPNHRLEWVQGANPPEYAEIAGQGDFKDVSLVKGVDGNNNTTWLLSIWYDHRTTCGGHHELIRATAADDPTGDFYGDNSGTPDASLANATCVSDD